MTDTEKPNKLFSANKKYFLQIQLTKDRPLIVYRNATILQETELFVYVQDARTGQKAGYSKNTILKYQEEP